jgi:tetratricopeptide (TPR) repeat protein
MAYFAQSQYEEAIQDFSQALELDKGSYRACYFRGVVKSVLRRYTEAVDDYTLSLGIHPYQAFCFYRRGQAYYHIEDYPAALADVESALKLDTERDVFKKFKVLLLDKMKM